MTFLPIVERELRVAARRPGTYRTRWFAAAGTLALWLVLAAANRRASAAELSKTLFVAFGILGLGFSLLAGVFLTADCLSEEKREGTLGLLFLTDLRGYDVVLGKLIATSVHSVYGLLAMFPVLALPLLMGGVTVGEFWRVVSVLLVTLLLSLGMGMFASAILREAREAMAGTFLGMLLLAGALPALWGVARVSLQASPPAALLWPSPPCAFAAALDSSYRSSNGPQQFCCSLQTVSGLGLGLLVLSALVLPCAWQEKAGGSRFYGRMGKPESPDPAYSVQQPSRPREALEANPYLWLASRARGSDIVTGILLGLLVLFWFCFLLASLDARHDKLPFVICLFSAYALHQVGKYLVAVDATQRLIEDRHSGALELLLVTPLGEDRILSGQMRALGIRSRGLRAVLLLVNAGMCLVVLSGQQFSATDRVLFLELFLGGMLVALMDCKALQTVGVWMALRNRKHQRAVLGALARVMLPPWAGIFLWVFLSMTRAISPSEDELGLLFALWFMLGILADVVVSAKARAGLGRGMRHWLAEWSAAEGRKGFFADAPPTTLAQSV